MGNIECILDEVNNLSDSDLKILVNKIMDRLKLKKAFASPAKVIPRMECPVDTAKVNEEKNQGAYLRNASASSIDSLLAKRRSLMEQEGGSADE